MATASHTQFERAALVEAFDAIGAAAVANGVCLDLAVYGGAAMMLASNFRFSTEDVDIAAIGSPWPHWLSEIVAAIAARNGWSADWLNDAVTFHLSPLASRAADHVEYGSFPRTGGAGLRVFVPTADYRLALKLKAIRTTDPVKGAKETDDIFHLMRVLGIDTADAALGILVRYFPRSGEHTGKQRSLLRHLTPSAEARRSDASEYPRGSLPQSAGGRALGQGDG